MAGYRRMPQRIGAETVRTAHRDFGDVCPGCGGYVERGQMYVKKEGELWHYRCRGRRGQMAEIERAGRRAGQ